MRFFVNFVRLSAVVLTISASSCLIAAEPVPVQGSVLAPRFIPAVQNQVMSGAVFLVATKDKVLHLEAVGYSDLEGKKPMQVDDLFWIASMTKPITGAAFMILVDEGKVKLDEPVEKYIPEFKNLKVAQPDGALVVPSHAILIREVLSHTSGMRFLNTKDQHVIDSVPLAESVRNDLLEPLVFDPGTKYLYSNEGIDVAGRIIEIVTGKPYEVFLQERLFGPLGMTHTTFRPTAEQLKHLAKSYRTNAEKKALEELKITFLKYPLDRQDRFPAPGGGLFSTAGDVARFCQMLANGGVFEGKTILSKEAVHQMTIKQTGDKVVERYGLGIDGNDGTVFGHGGAYKTSMTVDHGVVRVFLVQHTGKWASGDPGGEFAAAVRELGIKAAQ